MISRRHLLILLGAPVVLHAAPGPQVAATIPGLVPPWVRLILHFDHRDDLATIGEACLCSRLMLRDSDAERIYQTLAQWVGAPSGHPGEILAALPERIAADFECGAMESVDGWQLSHTEALLAILASKSDSCV
jgi:hypothetical protein